MPHSSTLAVGMLPEPGGESRGSWSVGRHCLLALLRGWEFHEDVGTYSPAGLSCFLPLGVLGK